MLNWLLITITISHASTLAVCCKKCSSSYLAIQMDMRSTLQNFRGPDAPLAHETVLSTALGDSAVDGGTRALIGHVGTGIDAPSHVERCDTIEVVARMVVNVGEEPIRVKRHWFTILRKEWFQARGIKGLTNVSPQQGGVRAWSSSWVIWLPARTSSCMNMFHLVVLRVVQYLLGYTLLEYWIARSSRMIYNYDRAHKSAFMIVTIPKITLWLKTQASNVHLAW